MFNKTSSLEFLKYGEVYTDHTRSNTTHQNNYELNITNDNITYMYHANDDVYLKTLNGVALLVITDDMTKEQYDEFVIHRIVKINRNSYFNFIPLGKNTKLELAFISGCKIENVFMVNPYSYQRITPSLRINELIAYYYNVRNPEYIFRGEKESYWEITYVDSGTLYTDIDGIEYELHSNDLIMYAPSQFHKQYTKDESSSYLSIIIDMNISNKNEADCLKHKVFQVDRDVKRALDNFVSASSDETEFRNNILIDSLNSIVVGLMCSTTQKTVKTASTPMQQNFENELINEILVYIGENIYSDFNNVEELCQEFGLSRSSLQNLFKNNLNIAPKRYILNTKLKKSKELIHESKYTISEISGLLGFSSIHYFSRRFKQEFGISPTDYANKIYKPN